jgi:hypothetical protein
MKTQKQRNSTTYEELLAGMSCTNKYDHLKIILNASHNSIGKSFQRYLWVTPYDFGIARLVNVDYENDYVILQLRDEINDVDTTFTIDINVPDIKLLLVNLEDVKRLVLNEIDKMQMPQPSH